MMDDMEFYERQEINDCEIQEEEGEFQAFPEMDESMSEEEFED
ncbi:MAG: hypothetical protein K0S04_1060 [Herbinix sp.]|jgi:hypothetical protein|nr:hypothetical protein [Herbinix sp.]